MKITKDSEYSFTTVTVGYLAITSVDGHKEVEVRVEGEYDHDGGRVNQRIIEEGSGDTLYDAIFLIDASVIPEKDKLIEHLDDVLDYH
tara:strand:+ start:237 stop:500 length:264 start_codon:yes stop_codon:yes gene_type:complete